MVWIADAAGEWHQIRCILDSGSQLEIITTEAAERLKLPQYKSNVTVAGVGGSIPLTRKIIDRIGSLYTGTYMDIELMIIPHLLDDLPTQQITREEIDIPAEIPLADPDFYTSRPTEVLLGSRVFYQIIGSNQLRIGRGPTFHESSLGWLAVGMLSESCQAVAAAYYTNEKTTQKAITNE